jgi:hypothetical protein
VVIQDKEGFIPPGDDHKIQLVLRPLKDLGEELEVLLKNKELKLIIDLAVVNESETFDNPSIFWSLYNIIPDDLSQFCCKFVIIELVIEKRVSFKTDINEYEENIKERDRNYKSNFPISQRHSLKKSDHDTIYSLDMITSSTEFDSNQKTNSNISNSIQDITIFNNLISKKRAHRERFIESLGIK